MLKQINEPAIVLCSPPRFSMFFPIGFDVHARNRPENVSIPQMEQQNMNYSTIRPLARTVERSMKNTAWNSATIGGGEILQPSEFPATCLQLGTTYFIGCVRP